MSRSRQAVMDELGLALASALLLPTASARCNWRTYSNRTVVLATACV